MVKAKQDFFIIKSYFGFVDKRFLSEFLYRTMFRYGSSLWVSLCAFFLNIFWFTAKSIERLKADCKTQEGNGGANFNVNHSQEENQMVSRSYSDLGPEEKGVSEFSFSFLYQESEDSRGNFAETDGLAFQFQQIDYCANTRKYQFLSGKNVSAFVQKPEVMSFTVQEMFVDSTDDVIVSNRQVLDLGPPMNEHVKEGNSEEKVAEFDHNSAEESARMEEANSVEEINDLEEHLLEDDDILYEVELLQSHEFSAMPKSENFTDHLYSKTLEAQSDGLPVEILAFGTLMKTDERKPEIIEKSVFEETAEDIDGEFIELKPNSKNTTYHINKESLSLKIETLDEDEFTIENGTNSKQDDSVKLGKAASLEKESWESDTDDEDEDELDILWEHQQLVRQMKTEMKNSKIKALPTISEEEEECETPKMVEDLKPLKIEEKLEYKDLMGEIHKFYKSYAEKMRKLDILNYQSFHAINIVQLKETQVFVSSKKASYASVKKFSLPSFLMGKRRKIFADPSLKSITEMQGDLELVYIGQVCLSWEILRWQYRKLKLLLECDSRGYRSYNLAAGEYQQLQVLMQRFLEDEPFQGPRIQHYVKSRCLCRSLLQVPMIKDDCFKDKKDKLVGEKDAIPITKLAEIIKESMQVFGEFIRADKVETFAALKGIQGSPVDHLNPADLELFINIKTCLEKKERKLKDIQRSANCIVKKFQKHQATAGKPSSLVFISQVELKLVSRVLNLSRLTRDQLLWCQKKLNNINIVNRKIQVEPAFLLFPC